MSIYTFVSCFDTGHYVFKKTTFSPRTTSYVVYDSDDNVCGESDSWIEILTLVEESECLFG